MNKQKFTQPGINTNKLSQLCTVIVPFSLLMAPGLASAAANNLIAVDDNVIITDVVKTNIKVLANDTYASKPTITVTKPANGKVRVKNNGTIVYIPYNRFDSSDSFTYTISKGGSSSTATVTISLADSTDNTGTDTSTGGTDSTDNTGTDTSTGGTDSTDNSGTDSSAIWVPSPGTSWTWQLQNYNNLTIDPAVDVYGIDLFDGINESVIARLKSEGKKVICYFSAGTREDWRPDADDFSTDSVIADGAMQDWPGEVWLDISNETALNDSIKPIMQARLDLAAQNGCDGIEPDNIDGYENTSETQGFISSADQLNYNKWLATEAHARGLSIALKNDIGQANELEPFFDFAINEQCFAYGNECTDYEDNFLKNNKAVFNQEYYTRGSGGEIDEYTFQYTACPYFEDVKISSLWKEGYELDGVGVVRCN